MRLIDADNLTLSYAGLAKMSPHGFGGLEGITKLFYDQIQEARTVEAIPIDFIETLKADPANAGDKIRVLSWLSREWEKAAGRKTEIDPEEECLLVVAPDVAETLKAQDNEVCKALLICEFAPAGTALIVKAADWERMIDNGDVYERREAGDAVE